MLNNLKNYSLALIELVFYFFAHYYTNTQLGTIFYLLFCLGMLIIIGYGYYRIQKNNKAVHIRDYPLFFVIILCCLIYGIHGIISSIFTLLG